MIVGAFMVPHPPLIIPEVGRGGEKEIIKTTESYLKVAEKIAELKPDTIIISSPHSTCYTDYFHISPGDEAEGSFARFGAPNVNFHEKYDTELVDEICSITDEEGFPAGRIGEQDSSLDHGTMVPLYFVRQKYNDFKLVRISISYLSLPEHYELGQIIQKAVNNLNRRVVYIASGDLSHKLQETGPYGFAPEGPIYDQKIMDVCSHARFKELLSFDETLLEKAAECGHPSFTMMAGALDGLDVETTPLTHEDITGVGYGLCIYIPTEENKERKFLEQYLKEKSTEIKNTKSDEYVKLARLTIEEYINNKKIIDIPSYTSKELLDNQAGVFVSIHKFGKLRGCIGTFLPMTTSIAQEIINNAISASTKDTRFDPIVSKELPYLEINVDVLSTPESISSKAELDPKKYGVIVKSGFKRGLLLPDLDGIDTIGQQIDIARRKANIEPNEKIELERFEVTRHK